MMLLESLEVKNFRKFEGLRIEFSKGVTVLVGANGSGKSAILDAAAIALATFFHALDVPAKTISRSDARIMASRFIGNRNEVRGAYPVAVSATGAFFGERLNWTRTLNSEAGSTTRVYAKQMTELSRRVSEMLNVENESGVISNDITLPILSYYGTGRLWSQKNAPQIGTFNPYKRESGYRNCLDASSDEKRLMSWMADMDYAEYKDRSAVPQYRAVCGTLAGVFSSISGLSGVDVMFDSRKQDIVVTYDGEEGRMELPMRSLSDGYRTALGMIGDIAYRMCELNPQLGDRAIQETPGIVLIDEVDLHLHPKWQSRVLHDLMEQFPLVQFVVTTHAPSVIASVTKEKVRILDASGAVNMPASQTYGRDPDSIFREVMDAPERQQDVDELFERLYNLLDADKLADANRVVEMLEDKIGASDPDLTSARTTLSLMKWA